MKDSERDITVSEIGYWRKSPYGKKLRIRYVRGGGIEIALRGPRGGLLGRIVVENAELCDAIDIVTGRHAELLE